MPTAIAITHLTAHAFTVPTDQPETDGTLAWSSTTLVLVQARAGDAIGIGYSYADRAAVDLIRDRLAKLVIGQDAMDLPAAWYRMREALRNMGVTGIAAMAISAIDNALWDLKARLLGLPLVRLLGAVRDRIPVYGSGGFTSYDSKTLQAQIEAWRELGITQMKIKVGREHDRERVREARAAAGAEVKLFVDANGAYSAKQALTMAELFHEEEVVWFEEPVPAWDTAGLCEIRARVPAGMEISAGEYGWCPHEFTRLIEARAIDVLQADATRCLGLSGFLQVGVMCENADLALSSHCAPALHVHAACAMRPLRHLEYFHDHVRLEQLLLDGVPRVVDGCLQPDRGRPGMGLEVKWADAERYRV